MTADDNRPTAPPGQPETALVDLFPGFYGNDFIRRIGEDRLWTISDKDKRPMNMRALLDYGRYWGARIEEADSQLLTLAEMYHRAPWAANCAYHFDALVTEKILIDIESTCPPEIAHRLLALSRDALYSETSMSGRGYHLVLDLPESLQKLPHLINKRKIRHPQGWYEILLDHWVTFTRNPIDADLLATAVDDPANAGLGIDDIIAELDSAISVRPNASNEVSYDVARILPDELDENIQAMDTSLYEIVCHNFRSNYAKTLDDFNGDFSSWEFSQLAFIARNVTFYFGEAFNQGVIDDVPSYDWVTRVVYLVAQEVIAHRDKHDGERNNMPYMLYQAARCVEFVELPGMDRIRAQVDERAETDDAAENETDKDNP